MKTGRVNVPLTLRDGLWQVIPQARMEPTHVLFAADGKGRIRLVRVMLHASSVLKSVSAFGTTYEPQDAAAPRICEKFQPLPIGNNATAWGFELLWPPSGGWQPASYPISVELEASEGITVHQVTLLGNIERRDWP